MHLSIIIPFVNEYPQVIFTIRNIIEELKDRGIEFEILAIDNYCWEVQAQVKEIRYRKELSDPTDIEHLSIQKGFQFPDRGGTIIEGSQRANHPHLKYLKYEEKLSHWNAKNIGIRHAKGEFLYFVDSHVQFSRDGLWSMFEYWHTRPERLTGTIAMPVTYKILDTRRQIYKLVIEDDGLVHYKFTPLRGQKEPFRVPCMTCCGVLMHKSVMKALGGGWPKLLGIYGGGENFLNFTLATFDYSVNIWPHGTVFHYGNPRGYHYTYDDFSRNRATAAFMFGGVEYMDKYLKKRKGDRRILDGIRAQVLKECQAQKDKITPRQKIDINDWTESAIERGWLMDDRMINLFRINR